MYLEYEAARVREYWVIDPASKHTAAYVPAPAEPEAVESALMRYRRLPEDRDVIALVALPGLRLRVDWLRPAMRVQVLESLVRIIAP